MNEARERLRSLEESVDFNTQLSIVSIVGGRGFFKFTVASIIVIDIVIVIIIIIVIINNFVNIIIRCRQVHCCLPPLW